MHHATKLTSKEHLYGADYPQVYNGLGNDGWRKKIGYQATFADALKAGIRFP